MKNKNIFAMVALMTASAIGISHAVIAAPPGPPPSSNLPNATFNSVSINTSGNQGVYSANNQQVGVYGSSSGNTAYDSIGVRGESTNKIGVEGTGWTKGATGVAYNGSNGIGVHGEGDGTGDGISGYTDSGNGVHGKSFTGVFGESTLSSTAARGVKGMAQYGTGVEGVSTNSYGVTGTSVSSTGVLGASTNSYGVTGNSSAGTGVSGTGGTYGGFFTGATTGVAATSTTGIGVNGVSTSNNAFMAGVRGYGNPSTPGSNIGIGVLGLSTSNTGVYGLSQANGMGIEGHTTSGIGVFGQADTAAGRGGYFVHPASGSNVYLATATNAIRAVGKAFFQNEVEIMGTLKMGNDISMYPGYEIDTTLVRGGSYNSGTGAVDTGSLALTGFPDVSVNSMGGSVKFNGYLASTGASYPLNSVAIKDPQGLMMVNYTTGLPNLGITDTGDIGNVTTAPVTVHDDQGFMVETYASSQLMRVDGSGNLTTLGGIGRVYKKLAPSSNSITAGAVYGFAGTVACNSGDRILSCGLDYSGSGNTVMSQAGMSGTSGISSCNVYAYNPTASAASAQAYAMCYSSNGTW